MWRARRFRTAHAGGMTTATTYRRIDTPIGVMLLSGRDGALAGLHLADHERGPSPHPDWVESPDAFPEVCRQLEGYFAGRRTTFDVKLDLSGTPFQLTVWAALRDIPYGETIGYGELARRIGRPSASRAVGAANGRNPVSIIVPCHRVIGADGTLTGYGWGTDRKAWLLRHEGVAGVGSLRPRRAPGSAQLDASPGPLQQGDQRRLPGLVDADV